MPVVLTKMVTDSQIKTTDQARRYPNLKHKRSGEDKSGGELHRIFGRTVWFGTVTRSSRLSQCPVCPTFSHPAIIFPCLSHCEGNDARAVRWRGLDSFLSCRMARSVVGDG
jgi:hypothetical protein